MCECRKTRDKSIVVGRKIVRVHEHLTKDEAPKYDHPHNPTPNNRDTCKDCGETHDDWSPEAREAAAAARKANSSGKSPVVVQPNGVVPQSEAAGKNASRATWSSKGAHFNQKPGATNAGHGTLEQRQAVRAEAKSYAAKLESHGIHSKVVTGLDYGASRVDIDPADHEKAKNLFAEHTGEHHPDDVHAAVREHYNSGAAAKYRESQEASRKYDH